MVDVAALRAYYFARHLPEFGYDPIVLSSSTIETVNADAVELLPAQCTVVRLPQWYRWPLDVSLTAVRHGLRVARSNGFDIVLGTGPTWGSLKTALLISFLTRRPLVADIRDPWTHGYMWNPRGRVHVATQKAWERAVLRRASAISYVDSTVAEVARGTVAPGIADKMMTIRHGFDDSPAEPTRPASVEGKCLFCHLGKLHPRYRSPQTLFEGMRLACRERGFADEVRLYLFGNSAGFVDSAREAGLERQIIFPGTVSLSDSRRYMRGADVLVLIQTLRSGAGDLATSKVYEYLAARRPILGVVRDRGAAAKLLGRTGTARLVGVDDPQRIADGLTAFWQQWRQGKLHKHDMDITEYSRRGLTRQLAQLFDEILDSPGAASPG
jgi:hypothetical protein